MQAQSRRGGAWAWAVALALVALVAAAPTLAQTPVGTMRGNVTGEDGAPLPGATITAKNTATGFEYAAVTGGDGTYKLSVAPGTYDVSVKMETFRPLNRQLQVLVGQNLSVNFKMSADAAIVEDVTVIGNIVAEMRTSEIATNVTEEQVRTLPQGERNFLNFAALAPGVRVTDDENASQSFSSTGLQARQVNVFIDGVTYKNDVLKGGAFMQDSSRGNPFPQAAVQEFRVLTQNYKAEYEKSAAAVITAVTKSGGNAWHGGLEFYYQDKGLVSQDPYRAAQNIEKPEYERWQGVASLGGPIITDKLHFFAAYEQNEQDRYNLVQRGSSTPPPEVEPIFAPYQLGNVLAPFESKLFFGKVSWQPASTHTLDLSTTIRDEYERKGFGGTRVYEGAENLKIGTESATLRSQWAFATRWLNEAALTYQSQSWNPTAIDETVPRQNYIGILDIGGKDAEQDFIQDRIGLKDDLSYNFGDHAFKGGISLYRTSYDVTKSLFGNPLFEFRSDEDWLYPYLSRYGFGNPGLNFDNDVFGIYLQDDWRITPRLELNIGLRWDYESNMINNDFVTPPQVVAALEAANRKFGEDTVFLTDFFDMNKYTTDGSRRDAYMGMIQPRIGLSYDLTNKGKTIVYGAWGRYYDRVNLNDIFDESYRQTWSQYTFCFSAPGEPAPPTIPGCSVPPIAWDPSYLSSNGLDGLIASGVAPGPEIFLVDNELEPPYSDQWNIGIRHTFGSWIGSLSYSNVRGYNGMAWFFGDLPPGTAFADRWGGNVPIPGYGRMFITDSNRQWWYDGYFLTLDKPFSNNWGMNVVVTYAGSDSTGPGNYDEGVAFGAFDFLSAADYKRHPGDNDERTRLVATGTFGLPWTMKASGTLTLGTGLPYTVYDASAGWDNFVVRWNEGRPQGSSFFGVGDWVYRSLDLRLQKAFTFGKSQALNLIFEGFNVLDWNNYGCYESFKPPLPEVNARFGQPTCAYNPRRYQAGLSYTF